MFMSSKTKKREKLQKPIFRRNENVKIQVLSLCFEKRLLKNVTTT